MKVLKRVGVLSCGKIAGVLYALIGLIAGAFMALFSLVGAGLAASSGSGDAWGALFGVGAVIILPILYGVLGFIGGLITAFLYNLIAGWIGGIEIELQDAGPAAPAY
jgi:hypothetical protein